MTDGSGAERFLRVTPAGCYYAIESREPTPERERLFALMRSAETPPDGAEGAEEGGGTASVAALPRLVEAGFVERVTVPERLPDSNVSDLLPTLLPALSERGRVVLTESRQGLFLDYVGVERDAAEELAVLAAALRRLAERSTALLGGGLGIDSRAFGIVDPAGNSEIGFWPLHIGDNVFTLTVLGIPHFNTPEFRLLVWVLTERYGHDGPGTVPAGSSRPS